MNRTLKRSDLDKLLEILELIPVGIVASQQQGLGEDRGRDIFQLYTVINYENYEWKCI